MSKTKTKFQRPRISVTSLIKQSKWYGNELLPKFLVLNVVRTSPLYVFHLHLTVGHATQNNIIFIRTFLVIEHNEVKVIRFQAPHYSLF